MSSSKAKADKDAEKLGYADAMVELEAILEELEGDDLDVDVLAERVTRASELIQLCRARISRANADVERIVADLDDPLAEGDEGVERAEG